MKNIKHNKIAVLASTLLFAFVLTACALGAAGGIENNNNADVDVSAKAMEIHELLVSGLNIDELEAEFGVAAENIHNAYDGQRNVYRFNLMTIPGYINHSISDGVVDWYGLRDGLVRIIVHIHYETFSGYAFHSIIYSPSEGRAYIIVTSGERTDVSDMLVE